MFARPKPAPFAVSALTHGILLGWLTTGPIFEPQRSVYQQAIAPHETKLVWYNFRQKLPNVSPTRQADARPPRAEIKAPQEIVAGSPEAPRANQFIWQPAPKVELKRDLESPNVVSMHAPAPAPPPPPPAPKPFTPPEEKKAAAAKPALDAPPELRLARNVNSAGELGNVLGARPAKLQPRAFVAPPKGQSGTTAVPALPSPPPVQVNLDASGAAALGSAPAAPARRVFVPADRPKPGGTGTGPVLADAPTLAASVSNSGVSLAIVGLHPSGGAVTPLPEGARNGQFSAGPVLRPNGGGGGTGSGAGLVIPGLMIRNGSGDSSPALMARAAPTSEANLRASVRNRLPAPPPAAAASSAPASATDADANASAARVTSAPDPILDGRAIYAMTVQMPNVTSYSGSWLIWFAEHDPTVGGVASVRAPVPLRKVDPKYIASAIADGIEGKVRLAAIIHTDGHVDSVRLLRHLDDRLDQSAADAMEKWHFQPAMRNGQPVDVDAVVEIPFHLAPKVVAP